MHRFGRVNGRIAGALRRRQANWPATCAQTRSCFSGGLRSAQLRAAAKTSGRAAKIHFIDFVVRSRQADPFISLFGPGIASLHVEPQAADLRALGRQPAHLRVERLKDALPAPALRHIDALDPPEETIALVAPFQSDDQLADNLRADLGHPEGSPGRVAQAALTSPPPSSGLADTGYGSRADQR